MTRVEDREEHELVEMFAELLHAAGIGWDEIAPSSVWVVPVGGGNDVFVRTARQGSVRVGMLPLLDVRSRLYDAVRKYAAELEAKRNAPVEKVRHRSAARIRRAVELREAGNSPARIAQMMTAEGAIKGDKDPVRTVNRWLSVAKSRTNRGLSDSP